MFLKQNGHPITACFYFLGNPITACFYFHKQDGHPITHVFLRQPNNDTLAIKSIRTG